MNPVSLSAVKFSPGEIHGPERLRCGTSVRVDAVVFSKKHRWFFGLEMCRNMDFYMISVSENRNLEK